MMLLELGKKLPRNLQGVIKKVFNSQFRRAVAMTYYKDNLALIDKWVRQDKETSNFYYKLTQLNRDHLAQLIVTVTGERYDKIIQYFQELDEDAELRNHLEQALKGSLYGKDIEIEYGRRIGWYTLVRVLKPKIVVETGVDHGVGACVLASALLRNVGEGHPGKYYGTDNRTMAGQLFSGKYATVGEILYDDSITSLNALNETIDFFVNDSDHSADYEYQEYLSIADKISDYGVILSDNAHATDSLSRFSRERNRKFLFFAEKPLDHWYPGAGIGISYNC
jgi:predicted O-methyltransferase YrrM